VARDRDVRRQPLARAVRTKIAAQHLIMLARGQPRDRAICGKHKAMTGQNIVAGLPQPPTGKELKIKADRPGSGSGATTKLGHRDA
jgi:hypothetical protein